MSAPKGPFILAIDQGTTSSRAIVFDKAGAIVADAQEEFPQHYPADGWVEHDPEDIWRTTLATARSAYKKATAFGTIAAIGVTNQRETTLIWNRTTGKPIHNAIVWQDRRTADRCETLKNQGLEGEVSKRSGLLLDPYFSATKAAWILDHVDGARALAEKGELAFGTVDSFLIWQLTGGQSHVIDFTNASRTNLFNIHSCEWDDRLLDLFDVPRSILPEVKDCAADFGTTTPDIFGEPVAIAGVAGDQQAASFGQACFAPGDIKSTYGTGCFVLINTGDKPVVSKNKLLSTIGWRLNGEPTYALEGSIFIAGAAVQWLRDELGIITSAGETEALARSIETNNGVYLVPAFTGLGAPHWAPKARGAIYGLTRGAGRAELARAALESVGYQTADLLDAVRADGASISTLRIDGGMVANDWMAQFLADILNVTVERPTIMETTARGAAFLAGLQVGLYQGLDEIAAARRVEKTFSPAMTDATRQQAIAGWKKALERTLL